jgi:hypothetical protein
VIKPINMPRSEIEKLGEAVSSLLDFYPGSRIESLVYNLGGRISYLGIRALDHMDKIPGIIVYGPGNFEIKVSEFTHADQDHLTVAHELGHYFLHSQSGKHYLEAPRYGKGLAEWETNWFAYAFLMPANDFIEEFYKNSDIRHIAFRFMVTEKAAELRANNLGLNG